MKSNTENQPNNPKMFNISIKMFEAVLGNASKSKLTPKEKASLLLDTFEDVISFNEEKAELFLSIADEKMIKSLQSLIESVQKYNNQCLNHVNRLSKQS